MLTRNIVGSYSRVFTLCTRESRRCERRNGLIGRPSMLNNDSMASCGVLGIFMRRILQGLLPEVSRDSTKPTKMITEQENNFWKERWKTLFLHNVSVISKLDHPPGQTPWEFFERSNSPSPGTKKVRNPTPGGETSC